MRNILTFDPPRVLEYEWRYPSEDHAVVRWELFTDGDGTRLVLDHRLLGADRAVGYGAGWHAFLDALEAYLRGDRARGRSGMTASMNSSPPT